MHLQLWQNNAYGFRRVLSDYVRKGGRFESSLHIAPGTLFQNVDRKAFRREKAIELEQACQRIPKPDGAQHAWPHIVHAGTELVEIVSCKCQNRLVVSIIPT